MKKILIISASLLILIFTVQKLELIDARADITEETAPNNGSKQFNKKVTRIGSHKDSIETITSSFDLILNYAKQRQKSKNTISYHNRISPQQ